jgi:quinoprotein relay system zinc metallohydrolase 1
VKQLLIAVLLTLSAAAPASDFDYGLVARKVAEDVYVFVGRTEDFTMANGGNIVNSGFIVAPEGVVVIDTGSSLRYGQQMRRAIAAIAGVKPIVLTINTHHHPDHFLGNQAFADAPIAALPETRQGIAMDGNAFAENLFRLAGDWMKGTEVVAPTQTLKAGVVEVVGRKLRLIKLGGHTEADLAVYDEVSGALFSGDLVFNGRAPTTPHADVATWLVALEKLEAVTREAGFSVLVPGHGEVSRDAAPIAQTRAWLSWLQSRMRESARAGLDMNEVLARPLPPEFADLPVAASEYRRSVGHLFPAAEQEALGNATLH